MNKYKAKKQTRIVSGQVYTFPSKAEAERFDHLVSLAKDGKIYNLSIQPEFIIAGAYNVGTTKTKSGISKVARMKYTPDFKYERDGIIIVEEITGFKTKDYIMRMKLFMSMAYVEYGISEFVEIVSGKETRYYLDSVELL